MQTLLTHPTPAALAKELGRLHSGKSVVPKARRPLESSWLVPWSHHAGRPAVVCIPPTGEGCGRFRQWQVELGDAVSVIGVQLPGRENRIADPHPSTLDEMVAAIASELTELLAPGQPLLVFGESYGGFIGYELTRRLGAAGRWPVALVLAASEPPNIRPEPERLVEHAKRVIARTGLDEDTQDLVLDLVRRDVELTRDYVLPADPGVATEVHIWGADKDELVSPERLDTWRTFLGTEIHRRHFTGGHVFVAEQGPAIARLIGEILRVREVSC
jgi:surfactin synthase thioesterase subunit